MKHSYLDIQVDICELANKRRLVHLYFGFFRCWHSKEGKEYQLLDFFEKIPRIAGSFKSFFCFFHVESRSLLQKWNKARMEWFIIHSLRPKPQKQFKSYLWCKSNLYNSLAYLWCGSFNNQCKSDLKNLTISIHSFQSIPPFDKGGGTKWRNFLSSTHFRDCHRKMNDESVGPGVFTRINIHKLQLAKKAQSTILLRFTVPTLELQRLLHFH